MPFHSRACSSALPSSAAYEKTACRRIVPGALPLSPHASLYVLISFGACCGSPSVQSPSAYFAAKRGRALVEGGEVDGRPALGLGVEDGALALKNAPSKFTTCPSSSRVMMISASSVRASCSSVDGQARPAGASFIASDEPTPRNARPRASSSSVAACCATTTGLERWTMPVTAVPSAQRLVSRAAAPSQTHALPEAVGAASSVHHGARWSEQQTPSKPAASAAEACFQELVRLEALMRERGVVLGHASLVPGDELQYTSPSIV